MNSGSSAFNLMATFEMVQATPNLWIRWSVTGYQYYLKRIINCDGSIVQPHWNEFNSNAKAKGIFQPDIYGFGGDNRTHVGNVHEKLFVRVNNEGECGSHTGGKCNIFSCEKYRNAQCKSMKCTCPPGTCALNGM